MNLFLLILNIVMINLLVCNMYDENNPKYHWINGLIEIELKKKENRFSRMLNFHFIELEKFVIQIKNNNNESNRNKLIQENPRLYFMKNPNDEYFRKKNKTLLI